MENDKKQEIIKLVSTNIVGRLANKIGDRVTDNMKILLDFVEMAGGVNHLEIGTLFGGSAICVALLKRQLNHNGMVFCIDPFDGYYRKYAPRDDMIDAQSNVPVTTETLFQNINKFNVNDRMFVMQHYSDKCIPFVGIKFSTAFIDGDHRDGVPLKDWNYVKDLVTDYVIFDNCADTHPDVKQACEVAANDSEWECVFSHDITFVVKRI